MADGKKLTGAGLRGQVAGKQPPPWGRRARD